MQKPWMNTMFLRNYLNLSYMWLFTILHKLLYRNTPHFPSCIDLKFLDPKNYRYILNIIRMF